MEATLTKRIRQVTIVLAVLLIANLLIFGANAYVTLAAPLLQQTPYTGPTSVAFEGYLEDSNGEPLSEDTPLTFRLYSAASGGTEEWEERHPHVPISDGLYTVQLGSLNTLPSNAFGGDRWLSIEVGDSTEELSPRIPITSVPWALNASQAYGLQGQPVSTTTPTDGDMLIYQSGMWQPQSSTGAEHVPSVRVYNTANLTGSGYRALTFDAERFDVDNLHAPGSSQLVAHAPGKYLIFGHVTSVTLAYSPPTSMYVQIRLGGSTIIAQQAYTTTTNQASAGQTGYFSISTVYQLTQNDFVELYVNKNVVSEGNYSPEFGMIRVGD